MTGKELKFLLNVLIIFILSSSITCRMVITKTDSEPSLLKKEHESNIPKKLEKESSIPERELIETKSFEEPPERNLKGFDWFKKKPTKKIKKKKKGKSVKIKKKLTKKQRKLAIEKKKSIKKFKKILQSHGKIEKLSHETVTKIIEKQPKKDRKLWWWNWYRRYLARLRRLRQQRRVRNEVYKHERKYKVELQRTRLRQFDRNKFDKLMERERKKDAELWSRTFIYDAILLTEKLVYMEHEKMFKTQMDLAVKNEAKETKKIETYYNKNYGKRLGELTPEEIEEDIFM